MFAALSGRAQCFLGARISRCRSGADAALAVRARRRALGTHVPHVPVDLRVEAPSIGLTCDTVGGGLTYGSAAGRRTRQSRAAGRLRHGSAVRGARAEYATGSARTDEAAGERVGHAVGLDELRRLAEDLKANLESRLFRFGLGWVSG